MPIKRINPLSDDDAFFAEHMSNVEKSIINRFCYVGEHCLKIGRITGSYTDRTGNLRNSVGYVVVRNGRIIQQATTEDNGGTEQGKDGTQQGREFIRELVGECKSGIYLIIVAGMKYASCVAAKGYDVLDSAELEAEKLMRQLGFVKK